jgi:putative N-acetyltransferase (TIGR04045 family)
MAEPASRSSAAVSPAASPSGPERVRLGCRRAATAGEIAAHFLIRHEVFVAEQGLFAGQDRDAHDEDPATIHVVGIADGVVCGTVRLYPLSCIPGRWKGDRLAVLPGYRHHGLGAPLVRFAVGWAAAQGGQLMEAFIQPPNVSFFERLGWHRVGQLVEYAGIPHQRMLIALSAGLPAPGRPRVRSQPARKTSGS